MNLDNLNKWLTLVANIGVLAGIAFLAIELQQSNKIAISSQFHERSALGHENSISTRDNDAWVALQARNWEQGFKPAWWNQEVEDYLVKRDLSFEDVYLIYADHLAFFTRMNNNYFQYTQGLIPESVWSNNIDGITRRLESPIGKAIAPDLGYLEPGLRQIISEIIKDFENQAN